MSGLCAPCRIGEHGFCAGNTDRYLGGYSVPAVRNRCACPCCPQEVRGVWPVQPGDRRKPDVIRHMACPGRRAS